MLAFVNVPRHDGKQQHNTQPMSYEQAVQYAAATAVGGRPAKVLRALKTKHRDPAKMLAAHESFLTDEVLAEFNPVPADA